MVESQEVNTRKWSSMSGYKEAVTKGGQGTRSWAPNATIRSWEPRDKHQEVALEDYLRCSGNQEVNTRRWAPRYGCKEVLTKRRALSYAF